MNTELIRDRFMSAYVRGASSVILLPGKAGASILTGMWNGYARTQDGEFEPDFTANVWHRIIRPAIPTAHNIDIATSSARLHGVVHTPGWETGMMAWNVKAISEGAKVKIVGIHDAEGPAILKGLRPGVSEGLEGMVVTDLLADKFNDMARRDYHRTLFMLHSEDTGFLQNLHDAIAERYLELPLLLQEG